MSTGQLMAGSILFQVTSLGSNAYRYDYTIDYSLLRNQEIDIRFDPALYAGLSNGIANSDFTLSLLQPGNPAGAFGDYSLLALIDNPSLAGPFGVQFTYLGAGEPGRQPYLVHQFDPTGQNIIATLDAGFTATVPEPATWFLVGAGLSISGILRRASTRK
ncbi:MAG: PEP-CTERM sorting domain-containing protein [Acidobacteria bacterium]|nr:PEP-CTERM sorting domain-containing protein [Acidobacteriota bacterium]